MSRPDVNQQRAGDELSGACSGSTRTRSRLARSSSSSSVAGVGVVAAPSVAAPTLEFGSCSPAHVAQAVEHFLGKEKVPGSNPGVGSIILFRIQKPCFHPPNLM